MSNFCAIPTPLVEAIAPTKTIKRRSNWLALPAPLEYDDIPLSGGCYAIYLDGNLSYVGQSSNLRNRLRNHGIVQGYSNSFILTPWGAFKKVTIKIRNSLKYGDWAMVELRLIYKLQPAFNRIGRKKA